MDEQIDWQARAEKAEADIRRLTTENNRIEMACFNQGQQISRLTERVKLMTGALRLHQAWTDSEESGPDYGEQSRATHPDGERIWRRWWDSNLSLCARAQEETRAALADASKG